MLIFATSIPAKPIANTMSRTIERERYLGLNAAREPDAAAMVALNSGRIVDGPTPLEEFIFFDHTQRPLAHSMEMDWKQRSCV